MQITEVTDNITAKQFLKVALGIYKNDPIWAQPLDKDIYGLSPEELKHIPSAPGSLEEALQCLKDDHEFLLKGDVFTPDVIEKWIEYKTEAEVNPVRMRPVPLEFELYYDI